MSNRRPPETSIPMFLFETLVAAAAFYTLFLSGWVCTP